MIRFWIALMLVCAALGTAKMAYASETLAASKPTLPPVPGTNYFNETHEPYKPPAGCYVLSKPATFRGTLLERTFYGAPWVGDTATPHPVLFIKPDKPLSICDISFSWRTSKLNVSGITGLWISEWLGFTAEWKNGAINLTEMTSANGFMKVRRKDAKSILRPYLNREVQVSGYLGPSNFATPWTIGVLRVCLIDHGKAVRCIGKLPSITTSPGQKSR